MSAGKSITLISCVRISSSEASSWCISTYLSHFARAFSFGEDTSIELGMTGRIIKPRSRLEVGLWSTHFSWPEQKRRCSGRTGICKLNRRQNSIKSNTSLPRKRPVFLQLTLWCSTGTAGLWSYDLGSWFCGVQHPALLLDCLAWERAGDSASMGEFLQGKPGLLSRPSCSRAVTILATDKQLLLLLLGTG